MRAFKRNGTRGFTLVELMIVVAIVGVLAALAIYGVRRYLASAKTSEAKNTIGAIARGAAGAYERETTASEIVAVGTTSTNANYALCASAPAVPATVPANEKYQPDPTDGADFETDDATQGWKCLKFGMNQPIYYQYNYNQGSPATPVSGVTAPTGDSFAAEAVGNLDGDTANSYFARTGEVVAGTGQLTVSTQVYVEDEFE